MPCLYLVAKRAQVLNAGLPLAGARYTKSIPSLELRHKEHNNMIPIPYTITQYTSQYRTRQ